VTATALPSSPTLTVISALAVDAAHALYAGFPADKAYTLSNAGGAAWTTWTGSGPAGGVGFFLDTHPGTNVIYAAGTGSGTGGVWSGTVDGIGTTSTISWSIFGTGPTNVTASSSVTSFSGLVTGGAPVLFAGTPFTAGNQYANLFKAGSDWVFARDGIVGANVNAVLLPSSSNVLAGTSGAGIFKTTSGGQ
jgi:hypothetical protein